MILIKVCYILLKSPHNWVGFHSLWTLNHQIFGPLPFGWYSSHLDPFRIANGSAGNPWPGSWFIQLNTGRQGAILRHRLHIKYHLYLLCCCICCMAFIWKSNGYMSDLGSSTNTWSYKFAWIGQWSTREGEKEHSNYAPNVVMVPLFRALFTSFCPTRTAPVLGKEANALLWILASCQCPQDVDHHHHSTYAIVILAITYFIWEYHKLSSYFIYL